MTPQQFVLFARIEQDHWWFAARRRIMRQILRRIAGPSKNIFVIDVGCGTGGNIASLADDYQCLGIDANLQAVELARGRFPSTPFVHGSYPQSVAGQAAAADLLLCMDVVEHIQDDRAYVKALVDSMKPGAHLLLTVPADMSLWSRHDVTNDHFRRYDRRGFEKLWHGLPMTPRLVGYFNSRLYPLVKLARNQARRRGAAAGEADTDFRMPSPPLNALLEKIFAGEARSLLKSLDRPDRHGYRRGVSLLALLRRENQLFYCP